MDLGKKIREIEVEPKPQQVPLQVPQEPSPQKQPAEPVAP